MTDKKHILFVDDEPNILDGLRRMLRSMRNEVTLYFAQSGIEALEIMNTNDIDIIVSDMRMPGMDGAQLLNEVRNRSPHTTRIMLTGQADEDSVMRCINVVHQFLSKPCDPEKLKDILLKSGELHKLMNDRNLKNIISGIERLPSLPAIYQQLQDKLNEPDTEIKDVAEIISRDPAMTAKILQLVNSSFFGFYNKVDTPERAVSLLGLETVKNLVLGIHLFSENIPAQHIAFINHLWKHSIAVGSMARGIAKSEAADDTSAGEAFVAGMLHDIGKLLLISEMESSYGRIIEQCHNQHSALHEVEKAHLHSSHCMIGAYLTGLWGFSSEVVEAIAYHHQLDRYPEMVFTPSVAVHFADHFYYHCFENEAIGSPPTLSKDFFIKANLEDRLPNWQALCEEVLCDER